MRYEYHVEAIPEDAELYRQTLLAAAADGWRLVSALPRPVEAEAPAEGETADAPPAKRKVKVPGLWLTFERRLLDARGYSGLALEATAAEALGPTHGG